MPTAYRTMILLLAVAMCCVVGCDNDPNTAYTTRDQYVPNVHTVYVPLWNRSKDVYRRELEFRISESVIKEIQASTPYKISDESRADTKLTGEVVHVAQEVMAFNPDTGNPLEKEITVIIAFEWVDLRSGKVLKDVDDLEVTATYIPDFGTDFHQGSQDLFDKAARRVVQRMEAEW